MTPASVQSDGEDACAGWDARRLMTNRADAAAGAPTTPEMLCAEEEPASRSLLPGLVLECPGWVRHEPYSLSVFLDAAVEGVEERPRAVRPIIASPQSVLGCSRFAA